MLLDNENDINLLVKNGRTTMEIENEMKTFMETEEGEKIKADVDLLLEMGYDKKMINKVYILLRPLHIDRAIDYMTEVNGIYQHDFFENHNPKKDKNLCFICGKAKRFHLDYIPQELIVEDDNLNNNNNFLDNNNNVDIRYSNGDSFNFSDDDNTDLKNDNEKKDLILNECTVCYEEMNEEEKNFNAIPCGHLCCTQCWLNYLKTLITEAKVDQIKCVEHKCNEIIPEEFVLKHIKDDNTLVDKYNKFKKRCSIIKDKNKKQCPKPDCESFLQKSHFTNYVKCENGHEFCFECLKPPHGKTKCEEMLEKDFIKWKKNKRVKRCPRCKIFTEKNEGCNHMTCVSCKYQWCWLCEGAYSYGHYNSGACQGHQFTRADNLKQARGRICCFTLHKIFPCYYRRVTHSLLNINNLCLRYLCIFVFWIFGFFLFAGFSMFEYTDHNIHLGCGEFIYYYCGVFIALGLFISFQIIFFCLITPFMLIALVYPYFFDNILSFLNIGETY